MKNLAPIIDAQYRTEQTYQHPKQRERVREFYQRGRVEHVVVQPERRDEPREEGTR